VFDIALMSGLFRSVLGLLPSFLLRWYWTEPRLASCVLTRVSSEHEGVRIDVGELPEFSMWLEVQNPTPFAVEVDRIFGEVFCGGRVASYLYLDRMIVPSLATERICIRADMSDAQARMLARCYQQAEKRVRVIVNALVCSKVRTFRLFGREIQASNCRVVNL
jgi:hypothetical protein